MKRFVPTLAVAIGGALGSVARVSLSGGIPESLDTPPSLQILLITLGINTLGALVLGLLRRPQSLVPPEWLRTGLSVGFLGAFTTWSAVVAAVWVVADAGQWLLATSYLIATLLLGLLAAWWGLRSTPRGESGAPA